MQGVYRHMDMNAEEFKSKLFPVQQQLFRMAFRFLGNVPDAEDLVQEVYLKLWNMREKLGDIQNPEAFATTVTRNLCLDRLKSRHTVYLDPTSMGDALKIVSENNPFKDSENSDHVALIRRIIDRLPDQQKIIMVLRDMEGSDFDEIQEITGLKLNNIRVSLSRARKFVRDELIKFHQYGTERNKKASGQIL